MKRTAISYLTLAACLLLAAGLGAKPASAAALAVAIVGAYGLILKLMQRAATCSTESGALACRAGAIAASAAWGALVYAWGGIGGLPFLSSLAVWTAIIGAGTLFKLAAEWRERRRDAFFAMRVGLAIN